VTGPTLLGSGDQPSDQRQIESFLILPISFFLILSFLCEKKRNESPPTAQNSFWCIFYIYCESLLFCFFSAASPFPSPQFAFRTPQIYCPKRIGLVFVAKGQKSEVSSLVRV
jgi:hypothetical protein